MIASVHHAACELPRNAELQAVAAADKATRERAAAKAEAYDLMLETLRRVEVSAACENHHLHAAVYQAIRTAEAAR